MAYVYKISGNGLDYYGSSSQNSVERKAKHKSDYRYYLKNKDDKTRFKCASHKIFESYGDDWENGDWTFEIIEVFQTQQEALEYENDCIINEPCINTNRAIGLTGDELRKYKAEWAEKKRRAEGVATKKVYNTDEERKNADAESKRNHMRKKRAAMSEAEKERILVERREKRTASAEEERKKQLEYTNRPEVKERRRLAQQAKREAKKASMTQEERDEMNRKRREK